MTTDFQPPPTYALPVEVDPIKNPDGSPRYKFSRIWLKWFIDLIKGLNQTGASIGSIAHNVLTGLQGGTTNEYYHTTSAQNTIIASLAHGTYTPTLTNVANLSASTAYQCQYLRVGNTIVVSGKADVDPVAGATLTQLGISLPVASNLATAQNCAGTAAASGIAGQCAAILGDATNDRAEMDWISGDVTNQPMYFTFTYLVI